MIQIARCESTFRHTLADGTVLTGRIDPADIGVMQINRRYHEARALQLGLDLSLIEDNMAYARELYEKQGTQPWSASKNCWSQSIAMR
jgi:chromosome condensin MukBEF complex kleisin-like MukF subunit